MKYMIATLIIVFIASGGFPVDCWAGETVRSSISITATSDGNGGERSVRVHTTVNGNVVTNWHSTSSEPISYSETIELGANDDSVTQTTLPKRPVDPRFALQEIIKRLTAILELYAKLSSQ